MVLKLNKVFLLMWLVGIILLVFLFFNAYDSEMVSVSLPVKGITVVLDPGHGGLDGGAVSESGIIEKDINLKIASYLEKFFENDGAKVIMTRADDISLYSDENISIKNKKRQDLLKRREITNKSGADIMISIHLNKFEQSKYKGAQVFYERNFAESKKMAESIQKSLKANLDCINTRMAMPIDSSKLQFQELSVPSVIVECGFLSNDEEAMLLSTEEYQRKTALAIYLGVVEFFA